MKRSLFAAILAVFAVACTHTPAAPELPSPVKIAVLIDVEDSAPAGQLRVHDFEPVISLLRQRGGEAGIGSVTTDAEPPFVRLRVDPPPAAPMKTGNALRDHQRQQEYDEQASTWEAETGKAVDRFRSEVSALLAGARTRGDDPWPLMGRAGLFLEENTSSWHVSPHRWVLYVGDREQFVSKCRDVYGERTIDPGREFTDQSGARWRCCSSGEWLAVQALARIPDGARACTTAPANAELGYVIPLRTEVRVITVKSSPGAGPLDDFAPARFESIGAALEYIIAEEDAS